MRDPRIKIFLEVLLIVGLCYFPLCYRIDVLAIRQWDEARNAVNTIEMLQNHNYIVRYYEGIPETYEVKPPLLIWLQVLSVKIFGISELAIRFPSIMATFLTVLLLIFYFHRYFNNRYIGYIAALVLVTSQGYVDSHIARTGDHDALLILLLTAIILGFYRYLISQKPKPAIIIGISLLLIIGVYTKSIATFFILPGLFIALFLFGSGRKLFTDKWWYIGTAIFIVLTGSYYVIREFMQPGYLDAVWYWELFPRYANTKNQFDSGTFWYYAVNLFKSRFTYWIWILIPAIVLLSFKITRTYRKFFFYILINTIVIFLVLSFGSKGFWYDGPLFPLFAIIIALFLYHAYLYTIGNIKLNETVKKAIIIICLPGIFLVPYWAIIKKVSQTAEYPWNTEYYSMSYLLRNDKLVERMPAPVKVIFEGPNAHLRYYVDAVNYQQGKQRLLLHNFSAIESGDAVLISQQQVMDSIKLHYRHDILMDKHPVKLIRIQD
jgi:4-amino-4-deoxy-L-arabinose transferase-like glycosyltransferase